MKISILVLVTIFAGCNLMSKAQDTTRIKVLGKNLITVVEGDGNRTNVKIGNNNIDIKNNKSDTVKVKVGRKTLVFSDGLHGSNIELDSENVNENNSTAGNHERFKGHWATLEIGINSFANVDYTGYTPYFMDLDQNKSFETGLNFLSYGIGLQNNKSNIGLVTGLGLTCNDYRFSNPYTIENNNGTIRAIELTTTNLSKTKLSTAFVTVPLMVEFQIPVNGHEKRAYLSGGLIGGLKVGSHTKIVQNGDKNKYRGDFNINPFRYGATARVGYKGVNVFGTYYFSTFFKNGRGPEMFPFTIGIGLLNW